MRTSQTFDALLGGARRARTSRRAARGGRRCSPVSVRACAQRRSARRSGSRGAVAGVGLTLARARCTAPMRSSCFSASRCAVLVRARAPRMRSRSAFQSGSPPAATAARASPMISSTLVSRPRLRRRRFVSPAAPLVVEAPLPRRPSSASSAGACAAHCTASRSCSTIRSVASSRLRSCERSSWAIAAHDRAELARARALRSASLRPGRLRDVEQRLGARRALLRVLAAGPARAREAEGDLRPNRLDVHGRDSPGRGRRPARFRRAHRRSGRPRCAGCARLGTGCASSRTRRPARASQLTEQLETMGIELDDDELQTTGDVAARMLAGQARARADHAGPARRPRGPAARRHERRRGADRRRRRGRGDRPRLLVPEPEPRVPRARGRRRALLPAQEPLVADRRRSAARRRRVRRRARVRRRHRGDRARQAERARTSMRRSRRSTPSRS